MAVAKGVGGITERARDARVGGWSRRTGKQVRGEMEETKATAEEADLSCSSPA